MSLDFLKSPVFMRVCAGCANGNEATSDVDPETEEQISAALERLRKGRTCFLIAHRLATVRAADRILVLQDGRIAEQGTHQQLLDAGGIYRSLYDAQFS